MSTRQQKRLEAQQKIIQHFEEQLPNFTDIFDERTFYIFAGCVVVASIVLVVVLSYFCNVTIQDAEEIAREKERRKRQRQQKLVEKLLRKKLTKAGFDENVDLKKTEELKKMIERISKQAIGRSEESELDEELLREDEEEEELMREHKAKEEKGKQKAAAKEGGAGDDDESMTGFESASQPPHEAKTEDASSESVDILTSKTSSSTTITTLSTI
jgi:hypothetical protein